MARVLTSEALRPAASEQISRLVRSISASLGEVQATWAGKLQLSVPQLNMLLIISDADDKAGMSVKTVAELLGVESTFVTAQSKTLVARGLLEKRSSRTDKRMIYLSLTPKARKQLDDLTETRNAFDASIKRAFGEIGTLRTIELLKDLDNCILRCRLRLQLEE
ncbi:MarR family transcriptional regulator [Bradyrhizobium sp. 180]|uniref:MarR family winged helix-turn-helix transcriptional regulator n=1 Tax=unclassified Bradyrhizobium TaxID=2631580 RepID=UPI001FF871FE|nr:MULTISPECIES: MarR family transcriptional regulator [unclassified Bradyrhizobium]MCK1421859.1 MarR family transcriptional regulator [Bradyrhizobium sp. CW12]MCK1492479.1 MarR family transcriptional regulator [Bradyrhizobium sp. 180]MCK1528608.1 MarR family transcriptional regulator [Bradyrhizobium sp. 182]MCK1598312.1 MarR family transcriptional regulator [Bradyrhizobium sp. 164]MCK1648451.1 MarR family transcriptional regulator [Bradyrhizobium sp. 154]